jgi:hypothetical protein
MQALYFGRFERLLLQDCEPVLSPMPRVVRELKFGGGNGPRAELGTGDFHLKAQVVELFTCFDELRNGVIEVLEVKHGLPFRVLIAGAEA